MAIYSLRTLPMGPPKVAHNTQNHRKSTSTRCTRNTTEEPQSDTLTQSETSHEQQSTSFRCPARQVLKQVQQAGAGGSLVQACTRPVQGTPSSAKMEAAAAAATSSAGMKPPARRGWTFCSRVPELQADGDHLDG